MRWILWLRAILSNHKIVGKMAWKIDISRKGLFSTSAMGEKGHGYVVFFVICLLFFHRYHSISLFLFFPFFLYYLCSAVSKSTHRVQFIQFFFLLMRCLYFSNRSNISILVHYIACLWIMLKSINEYFSPSLSLSPFPSCSYPSSPSDFLVSDFVGLLSK